jgi:ATP phosphoribosyltransferase
MVVDSNNNNREHLKLTLPTGRIQDKVMRLLEQIGISFFSSERSYRPVSTDPVIQAKTLKPQNIPALVALGRHDCGFSGHDWIYEQGADVVELLDLGFDPVRIVAAAPEELIDSKRQFSGRNRQMIVASEYERLARDFIKQENLNAIYLHAYGATEALPPEDADIIIDNTASGTTLRHNRLQVIGELMKSTTRFFCNKAALEDPFKRKKLDEMTMLMKSTIQAREKVLIEMNVAADVFDKIVNDLPCMKAPTVSKLHNSDGYAIKIAVATCDVPDLIPRLVKLGATDILEYKVEKIVV